MLCCQVTTATTGWRGWEGVTLAPGTGAHSPAGWGAGGTLEQVPCPLVLVSSPTTHLGHITTLPTYYNAAFLGESDLAVTRVDVEVWPGAPLTLPVAGGGMPEGEDRTVMERDSTEGMARDFSPYTQRLSSGSTKLGINSNIYSLYQNKQVRHSGGESQPGYGTSVSGKLSTMTESPVTALQSPYPDMAQEKLYSACMQERVTTSCKEQDTMEPDSSTDSQEQSHGLGQAYDGGGGGGDVVEEEEEAEDEDEDEENGVDERKSDRMQKLLAEHARMFNPKLEPESKRPKPYKSPQEELAELMKLTNEKLFKSSNQNRSLPLSVEIDEQDSSCDSVSPPRNPYMVTNSLSPRKRGRKPKHYSEILYELGQRGISITKTSKPSPLPASTEMVVSENGAVSHKASGQQLKCPHCNKILTTSVGLMYHIRLHTGQSVGLQSHCYCSCCR